MIYQLILHKILAIGSMCISFECMCIAIGSMCIRFEYMRLIDNDKT
jgi:hypothetical protein